MFTTTLQDYITSKTKHEVQTYGTGEECLDHLADEPDVIILDYNLDDVDKNAANGSEILETIKKIDPTIHVVMLSGQDAYGTALQTIMKGADSYIVKDEEAFDKIVKTIDDLN